MRIALKLLVAVIAALALQASAVNVYWNNNGGDQVWTNADNWGGASQGVPGSADDAYLNQSEPNGPIFTAGLDETVRALFLGVGDGTYAEMEMTGGHLTTTAFFNLNLLSSGTHKSRFDMSGGTLTADGGITIGLNNNDAVFNMSGGLVDAEYGNMGSQAQAVLSNGTVDIHWNWTMAAGASLDIYDGKLIVRNTSKESQIQGYIDSGLIVAHGGAEDVVMYNDGSMLTVMAPADALVFVLSGDRADQYVFEALQGLVNRAGPRLMRPDPEWQAVYEQEYGLTFGQTAGLTNLIEHFKDDIDGLVVYDEEIDGSRCVAMTMAGVYNLLPVTNPVPYSALGLAVAYDLRGQFTNSVEAYNWALTNVMPHCNRKFAHTPAGGGFDDGYVDGLYLGWGFEGFDYTVMNTGFVFNLTFEYEDVGSFGGRIIDGDPTQADLYRTILDALEAPAFILGYGEWENHWFDLLGEKGHQYLHTVWNNNLSFHAGVSANGPLAQQVEITPANVTVEPDKYYVCFVTSEGDTMKGPATWWYDGWFDPARGSVPMNWAVHPAMSRFPAMLEHYYTTATSNDQFVGMQVYNYAMADVAGFAQAVKLEFDASGLLGISGSFGTMSTELSAKRTFAETIQPVGMFDSIFEGGSREGFQEFYPDGTPLVGTGNMMTYWHRLLGGWDSDWKGLYRGTPSEKQQVLDALTGEIEYIASQQKPPFVIVVYTDMHNCDFLCEFHADVAAQLGPEYKVARLDEAFSALRKWHTDTAPVIDGFEIGLHNWATDWIRTDDQQAVGKWSAKAGPGNHQLESAIIDTRGRDSISINFRFRDAGIDDDDDVFLQLWNGSAWVNSSELGNSSENIWHEETIVLSNSGAAVACFRPDFKLRFEASGLDSAEYLWIDEVRVTLSGEGEEDPFSAWVALYGLAGSDTNLTADIEPDGLVNLLEYALGGNPTNDDAAAVMPAGFVGDDSGTNWLYYVHNERTDDDSLTYTVGTKTNLVTDASLNAADVSVAGESAAVDSIKSVTNRTEAAEAAKFIGLEVEKN